MLKLSLMIKILFLARQIFQSDHRLYEKREGSGSVPLTNGSGYGKPKNLRIWIWNTASYLLIFSISG
jgi:hypothetical protein